MKRALFLLVAGLVGIASTSASDWWTLEYKRVVGQNVNVHYRENTDSTTTFTKVPVTAGLFEMYAGSAFTKDGFETFQQGTFYTYCTDVGVTIQRSHEYDPVAFAGVSGVKPEWRPEGIYDAAWLYNLAHSFGSTQSIDAAGMQLAIWKVLYDDPSTSLTANEAGTRFYVTPYSTTETGLQTYNAVVAAAQRYLADLQAAKQPGGDWRTFHSTWLKPKNGGSQGLLYDERKGLIPVPDGGLTILLLGLSCMGLGVMSRRRKGTV